MKKLSIFAELLRKKDPVTLEIVSELGVSRSTRSRWARGVMRPSVRRALALQAAYESRDIPMPLSSFLDDK